MQEVEQLEKYAEQDEESKKDIGLKLKVLKQLAQSKRVGHENNLQWVFAVQLFAVNLVADSSCNCVNWLVVQGVLAQQLCKLWLVTHMKC